MLFLLEYYAFHYAAFLLKLCKKICFLPDNMLNYSKFLHNYALHQKYTQARTSACFAEIHNIQAFKHRHHGTGASKDESLKEKRKEECCKLLSLQYFNSREGERERA